jgi:hypothetical protein
LRTTILRGDYRKKRINRDSKQKDNGVSNIQNQGSHLSLKTNHRVSDVTSFVLQVAQFIICSFFYRCIGTSAGSLRGIEIDVMERFEDCR